jgi:hypothetical protein
VKSWLVAASAVSGCLHAAIFPESWGAAKRGKTEPVAVADIQLARELNFETGERAEYSGFSAIAWRFKDPTSALVFYLANRPPGATMVAVPVEPPISPDPKPHRDPLTVIAGKTLFANHGNYVVRVEGWTPSPTELKVLYETVPKLDRSALPVLPGYLPADGLKPNSERYVVGPVSLEQSEPRVSAGQAAFSMEAEAVVADYPGTGRLSIFNYPTPEVAKQRTEEFRKIAGGVVKRSGPLVALVLPDPSSGVSADSSAAERLLAKVGYQATLTWNEPAPGVQLRDAGRMMLSIFALVGVLIALCLGAGVTLGMLRFLRRRYSKTDIDESMITLDLSR